MIKKTIFIIMVILNLNLLSAEDSDIFWKNLLNLNNRLKPSFKSTIKTEMSILTVVLLGIKSGIYDGIQSITSETISYPLSAIRTLIELNNRLFWQLVHRLSFGANKLSCRNLMLINNHIYTLCMPFLHLRQVMKSETAFYDQNWDIVKESLVSELRHAYFYTKKALPCYSPVYLTKNYKPNTFTRLIYSFCENNEQIAFYITRTIFYIDNLIRHIESLKTYQDSLDQIQETRRWLSWVCESFEQTSRFLTSQQAHAQYKFYKLDLSFVSNLPHIDVDDYLIGGNN